MKENNEPFDIERFKDSEGVYHLENEKLPDNALEELYKILTSEDKIIVQKKDNTEQ